MNRILFYTDGTDFEFIGKDPVRNWILSYVLDHGHKIGSISYVFVDDERMLDLNKELLDHDFYTDIITVPLENDPLRPLSADIFISISRVKDNALQVGVSFVDELHRVMIHGILHLMGYDDHSGAEKEHMREMETAALALRGQNVPRGTK